MCLIIGKKAGEHFPYNTFNFQAMRAMRYNPDGVGFGIRRENGSVYFKKGLLERDDVIRTIKRLEIKKDDDFIFHARVCTAGKADDINCHPFPIYNFKDWFDEIMIQKKVSEIGKLNIPLLFHNGGFSEYKIRNSIDLGRSDSFLFSRDFVAQFQLLENEQGETALSQYVTKTAYNKICVLHPERGLKLYGSFYLDKISNLFYSQNFIQNLVEIDNEKRKPQKLRVV